MPATLSSLNVALQRVWTQKTLEEQMYQGVPFLDKIERTTKYQVGETARVPLHVGRNGGYTALPAGGGNLNTAGNQALAKAEYNYTNHHQQVAIQGDVIDGTSSANLSIVDAVDLEVKGAVTDIRRQINRQAFMAGDALIAQCRASATNNVDLSTGIAGLYSGVHATSRGWIFVGQPVDVGTTANEVAIVDGASNTVTAVDTTAAAPNFTVSGGNVTTEGTTHYVSQKDSRSGTTSYEMNGLWNIASQTLSLGGLSVASQPLWKATEDSATITLSVASLLTARTAIYQASGEEPDFFLTSPYQAAKLYGQLQQQVRYTSDSSINVGNLNTPRYLGMELWQHPDCQDSRALVGRFDTFLLVAIDKPYWQNKVTGGEILSWGQGTDAYVAKLTYRINLAAKRRNTLYAFTALT